jgi:hypothetical protein
MMLLVARADRVADAPTGSVGSNVGALLSVASGNVREQISIARGGSFTRLSPTELEVVLKR